MTCVRGFWCVLLLFFCIAPADASDLQQGNADPEASGMGSDTAIVHVRVRAGHRHEVLFVPLGKCVAQNLAHALECVLELKRVEGLELTAESTIDDIHTAINNYGRKNQGCIRVIPEADLVCSVM